MKTNRVLTLILATMLIMACGISTGPAAQPPGGQPTYTPLPTYTPQPTYTSAAPPTETPVPVVEATPFPLAQTQWNGKFRWFGRLYSVSMIIQEVKGSTFTGAMYWVFSECKVNERVKGDIITDITSATEQNRWALHPDYQNGDLSGTWLRWTQYESFGDSKCYLTISGDWWYGHITSNNHLIGIHFTNQTNTEPDRDANFDFTLQ